MTMCKIACSFRIYRLSVRNQYPPIEWCIFYIFVPTNLLGAKGPNLEKKYSVSKIDIQENPARRKRVGIILGEQVPGTMSHTRQQRLKLREEPRPQQVCGC